MDFKRHLPTREQLRNTRSLQFLGHLIFEPNLWHFNRHSLSFAALIGGFCCFLPIPFQMIPAVLLCIWIRCNIPVTIAFVWISNPITLPPMLYFAWHVGAWVLGIERAGPPDEVTLEWFSQQVINGWQPLLLGSVICGSVTGITGFLTIRIYYRWRIARYKHRRKSRKPGSITRM